MQPGTETFFEPTRLRLFGKPFAALTYDRDAMKDEFVKYTAPAQDQDLAMPPRRIERTLRRGTGPFARIYSFSFEGHYYKLPRPLLFLVTGKGEKVEFDAKTTGIEARDWKFSEDLRVWTVDRKDLALCLDVEVANYEQLLLDSMIAFEEEMAARGSASARGSAVARGSASARGSVAARGSASFRGSMLGPHQER